MPELWEKRKQGRQGLRPLRDAPALRKDERSGSGASAFVSERGAARQRNGSAAKRGEQPDAEDPRTCVRGRVSSNVGSEIARKDKACALHVDRIAGALPAACSHM